MKKSIVFFVLLGELLCAQPKPVKPSMTNDAEAEKYLKALKSKFNKLKSYKLNYSMTSTDANNKSNTIAGNYIGSKDKYIIETKGLSIYNNGIHQWNINHENQEIQINTISSKNSKAETPVDIIKNYSSLFKYRVKEPINNGVIVLELIPLNKNNNFFKIDVALETKKLQIVYSKLYDRGGNRIIYKINSTEEDIQIAESAFIPSKTKYKGYEELDMR